MKARFTHLYLHGGPGFNSFAESELLPDPLARRGMKAWFWNEPSRTRPQEYAFRPENAYLTQLESIKQTLTEIATPSVTLIAHSFAAHASIRVAREMPEKVSRLVLLTPVLDFQPTYRNVMKAAEQDFRRASRLSEADELARLLAANRAFFDPPMQDAFRLVAQDPELFLNYWHDQGAMTRYLEVWQRMNAQIDLESFFAVLKDLSARPLPLAGISTPTLAIFGRHDRIERREVDGPLVERVFSDLRVEEFTNSAHFPHLEETDRFVELLS